ncbi:MAG TPA: MGMT family protein [Bryobacterales bacterium]|jgi:methylated-DNA-protein-cysteine methyltransferase-like protein|nr:MGMT family protein [Bryobacterales bacterium]
MPGRRRPQGYYKRVWEIVRLIPSGRVSSYGAVARAAGFPGTARQVAWALRGSPRSANLPWHRVIGAGGKILLSGEAGIEQRLRLQAEGVAFRGARVQMDRHEYRFSRGGGRPQKRKVSGR